MLLPLHLNNLLESADAAATLSGTAVPSLTERQIVAGGETIVITLVNETWVAAGPTFDGIRQDIIDGLDSAQSETFGWNNEVRDKEVVGAVVRTSDTVVTITLSASSAYDITAAETITVTVPASAVVGASPITATPTIEAQAVRAAKGGRVRKRRRYVVEIDGQFFDADNIAAVESLLAQARLAAMESAPRDASGAPAGVRLKPPRVRVKTGAGRVTTSVTIQRDVERTQKRINAIYRKAQQQIAEIRAETQRAEAVLRRKRRNNESIISLLF